MKKFLSLSVAVVLFSGLISAGVVKKTKSEVSFKELGKFTSEQEFRITSEKKWTFSKNSFKGKGILGKTLGSTVLKSGETGEIIDLSGMIIFDINHKKKEYSMRPIEKIEVEAGGGDTEAGDEQETPEEESSIRIIRSEFKVEDTGETKTIHEFACRKYLISWVTEWEDRETGQTGTDSLSTDVWTTPMSEGLRQAQDQETQFSREYMKRQGFEVEELQQVMLGTSWMNILSSAGQGGAPSPSGGMDFGPEMKKIQGYPVVIDGKYYAKREGGEAQAEEESGGGLAGKLGGFAKKAISGSKKDSNEPAFTYFIEVLELSPISVGDEVFQVPAGYKKKD